MELSYFQKEIIDSILRGETYDICTFIYKFLQYYSSEEGDKIVEKTGFSRYADKLVLKNFEKNYGYLKEYVALIEKLKKDFLVVKLEKDDNYYESHMEAFNIIPTILINNIDTVEQPVEILTLIKNFEYEYFIPLADLVDFKNKGYKTLSEYSIESEIADRKRSMLWTKIIAGISIAGVLFSSLFNYFTYKNERVVEIKNMPSKDTVKAIILNYLEKDSSVMYSSKNMIELPIDTIKNKAFIKGKK